jgi:MFS family permease
VREAPPAETVPAVSRQSRLGKTFQRYVAFRTASLAGDAAWWLSLSWVAVRSAGPVGLGEVLAAGGLPKLFLAIFGGALADRVGIRKAMITADCVAGIVASAVGIGWIVGVRGFAVLVSVASIFGVIDSVYMPASKAFGRTLVPAADLGRAYAALQATGTAAGVLGAGVGGFLIAHMSLGVVAVVDAATFFVTAVGLSSATAELPSSNTPASSGASTSADGAMGFIRHAIDGFRVVLRTKLLRLSLARAVVLNCIALAILNVGIVVRVQQMGWGSAWLGAIDVSSSLAMFATGMVMSRRRSPQWPGRLCCISFVLCAVCLYALVTAPSPSLACAAGFALGTFLVPASSLGDAVMQAHVPASYAGAVNGMMLAIALSAVPVGSVGLGYLSNAIGNESALIDFGLAMVGFTVLFSAFPTLWRSRLAEAGIK